MKYKMRLSIKILIKIHIIHRIGRIIIILYTFTRYQTICAQKKKNVNDPQIYRQTHTLGERIAKKDFQTRNLKRSKPREYRK